MVTLYQLISDARKYKYHKGSRARGLEGNPQRLGVCYKVLTMKPKKPNSANRKIAKVRLVCNKKKRLTCYIPGIGHNLREYSQVLIRGGQIPDLPGVNYKLIRGKYDFSTDETIERKKSLSKYGKSAKKKV